MSRRGPQGPRREHFCPKCQQSRPLAAFDRYLPSGSFKPYCRACGTKRGGGPSRANRWKSASVISGQSMSAADVAKALGITKQGVTYIETRALAKLRARAPWLVDMLRAS